MSTQTVDVNVQGMTCGHCVRSVQEEIREIPGVTDVEVELVSGGTSTVKVTSTEPVSTEALEEAVKEAGYSVAPPRSLL
ncbi:heavy-metal-associated domain-containing protein [Actinotalea sp. Marseille-Q4924]|uniref:heavy-metal-associated domain-containing protein n=1 Tax=Actinotalea sp. Marseille-Q4924 TaxID=2866571 RepID=UPI001CE42DEB|nr:heavy metal-associated domain-containing protein [Actinotalea sp. Marseille-Q4924]